MRINSTQFTECRNQTGAGLELSPLCSSLFEKRKYSTGYRKRNLDSPLPLPYTHTHTHTHTYNWSFLQDVLVHDGNKLG